MNLRLLVMTLVATPLTVFGCAPSISHHSAVVATGEHCEEDAGSCSAPLLLSDESDLEAVLERWGYAENSIEWASRPLLLLAMTDSSDCKVEVAQVNIDRSTIEITTRTFLVRRFQDECVTDAIPRSFIIQLDTDNDLSTLELNGQPVTLVEP